MGTALRMILEMVGLRIIDVAYTSIIKRFIVDPVIGPDEQNTGTNGTTQSDSDDETEDPNGGSPNSIKFILFNNDSVVRVWLDNIVKFIFRQRKDVLLSQHDILYSCLTFFKNNWFNEQLYQLIDKNLIVVEVKDGKEIVSWSDQAINTIISMFGYIYNNNLQNSSDSFEIKSRAISIPSRVLSLVDETYRSKYPRFISKVVSIPPVEQHVVYDKKRQTDIFGNQLITGKVSIIKIKDTISDVYSYAMVCPKGAEPDRSLLDSGWILSRPTIDRVFSFFKDDNTDLLYYEINYNALEKLIKIIY